MVYVLPKLVTLGMLAIVSIMDDLAKCAAQGSFLLVDRAI